MNAVLPQRNAAIGLALMLLAFAITACGRVEAVRLAPLAQPNIIVISTDDQTVEQLRVMSETTEWLEAGGTRFERFVASYPMCCPSRATLLTGQYAQNHGVLWNTPPAGGFAQFRDQNATLATSMQAAGYQTLFVGKYLNGYGQVLAERQTPPGWSDFIAAISPTQSMYYNYTLFDNGYLVTYGASPSDYLTDVITTKAVNHLSAAFGTSKPVFMWLSYAAPHDVGGDSLDSTNTTREALDVFADRPSAGPIPAPRHVGHFAAETLPGSPAFNEADVSDKPSGVGRRALSLDEQQNITREYRAGLESLLAVDEGVKKIRELLASLAVTDNTYVFFTSDNGKNYGEHRLNSKYFPYEETLIVPLLVAGPGVRAGAVEPSLTANIDLAPTIVELAGATPPRLFDGRSLVPLLHGVAPTTGRAVLIEGYAEPAFVGVHTGDAVYVEYESGVAELYDLRSDPYQLVNIAGSVGVAALERRMRTALAKLVGCAGSRCDDVGNQLLPIGSG